MTERVVERHLQATAAPSRPALTILTKLSKGIKGTVNISALTEALSFLPGWSVSETTLAVPIGNPEDLLHRQGFVDKPLYVHGLGVHDRHYMFAYRHNYDNGPVTSEIADKADKAAEDMLATFKSKVEVVSSPKGPTSAVPGKFYVRNLRIELDDQPPYGKDWNVAWDECWYGTKGWVVTGPKGSVSFGPRILYTGKLESDDELAATRFWAFAAKSGLKEQALEFLRSMGDENVDRVMRPSQMRSIEDTGTCPCCFVNVKLHGEVIMRHGWSVEGTRQRGGYGQSWHTGPCFGMGYQPFEISPKGTEDYLKAAKQSRESAAEHLVTLRAEPDPIKFYERRKTTETVIPKSDPRYRRELAILVSTANHRVREIDMTIDLLQERIRAWEPKPLPGTKAR